MRLTLKLTLILSVVVACGLVAQALLHIRRMRALHADETRDDALILANALATASSEIWSDRGEASARAFLRRADERRARTRIRVLPAGKGGKALADKAASELRENELITHTDIIVDGRRVARLELVRTRKAERAFMHDLLLAQLATVAAVVGACAVLALVLGLWLVGRPVEQLIAQARRVGEHDFSIPASVRGRDELGRLAREMNDMATRLAEAEARARRERRGRAQAFEQLRHADRLSTVGKLASGIAHELGTPLNVVSGRSQMIMADADAGDSAHQNARTIVDQVEHMTSIVRQLLDFSRRRGIQAGDVEPHELLEQAAMLTEPLADEQNVVIEVDAGNPISASLDSGKTLQVLTNLIVNAISAMPEGGTIWLAAERRHVDSPPDRHAAPGDFVCFSVRDQGVGIATKDLEHIFEPFFTTKSAGEGTGLGLSVCHGIVREHGGWIEADSEPGAGCEFRVFIPLGGEA